MFLLTRLQSSAAIRAPTPTTKLSAAMLLQPTAVLPVASASTRAAATAANSMSGEWPSRADVAQALAAASAMPATTSATATAISAPTPSPIDLQAAAAVFSAGADAALETSRILLQFWKTCKRRCNTNPTKSASPYALAAPTGVPSPQFLAKMAAMEAARAAKEEPAPEPDHTPTPTDDDARAGAKNAVTATATATATTKTAAPTPTATPTPTPTSTATMASIATELLTADEGAACCVLLGTSLQMEPVQRSDTDRARRILQDLRIVFREMDAATSQERALLDAMTDLSGVKGQFPQLFVATRASDQVRCISLGQLEQAEHFLGVPRQELARLKMEHATARVLFPGVATVTPTFNALPLPALQRALA